MAVCVPTHAGSAVRISQGDHAGICDVRALDKPDPLELWKSSELCHRVIGQICAATKVDVADPVAERDQALDTVVGDVGAVSQMEKVQVPPQPRDGVDGRVGEVPALLQHEVPKPGRDFNDLFHRTVRDSDARREVENTQMVVGPVRREGEEGEVVDTVAACQAQLTEGLPSGEEGSDGFVADESALLKIYFEDVGTVFGKRENGFVLELAAVVQFELGQLLAYKATFTAVGRWAANEAWRGEGPTYSLQIPAMLGKADQALVGNALAAGYVKALQTRAVLGDRIDRGLGNVVVQGVGRLRGGERDVKRVEVAVAGNESDQAGIRQPRAARQGHALDARALS